jgi:putative transposase
MGTLRRVPVEGRPVFLTIVTANRRPWLKGEAEKQCVLKSWSRVSVHRPFESLALVILDDHIHGLLVPGTDIGLDQIVGAFKREVSWALRAKPPFTRPLWQSRFYDHVIRDEDDLYRHLDYIHFNPVKHGYCLDPAEYQWSSLRTWQNRGVYPPGWTMCGIGDLELE